MSQLYIASQGTEVCPEEILEGEGENVVCTNEADIRYWRKRDCYARLIIFNSNDDDRQKALFNCKSAHEMWNRLNTQYLQRAADNKHLLHREFLNLWYQISNTKDIQYPSGSNTFLLLFFMQLCKW